MKERGGSLIEETEALPQVQNGDLPALFCVADEASLAAQRRYLLLVRLNLLALFLGALLLSLDVASSFWQQVFSSTGAALLALALLTTLIITQKSYKERWYGGRAAAESIKTLAWRYMMRAEPFDSAKAPPEADELFAQSMRELLRGVRLLAVPLDESLGTRSQISDRMRAIRSLPVEQRKRVYLTERIQDQRAWYSRKAAASARSEERLFLVVVLAQGAALVAAIWMINAVGALSTMAAAVLAWLQVKQHEELAQSYLIAAQELGFISDQSHHVSSEESFSAFVADAEAAISREHTLWLARRDRLPSTFMLT